MSCRSCSQSRFGRNPGHGHFGSGCCGNPRRAPSDLSVGTKRALFQGSKPAPKDVQETASPATVSTSTPTGDVEAATSSPTTTAQSVVVGAKACHPNANLSLDDYIVEEDPSLREDLQKDAEEPPREACRA